jgi:hypothetical protein
VRENKLVCFGYDMNKNGWHQYLVESMPRGAKMVLLDVPLFHLDGQHHILDFCLVSGRI